jgi:hypothetical protein
MKISGAGMENYREYNSGWFRWIDRSLSRLVERRTEEYINRYAYNEAGQLDEDLADLIRYEVRRRGHMSMELDVLEPIRWTGISTALSFLGGMGAHRLLGEQRLQRLAKTGAVTGTTSAAISLIRPYLRFDAALYGAAQTALGIYDDKYNIRQSPGMSYLRFPSDASQSKNDWSQRVKEREKMEQEKNLSSPEGNIR